MIYIMQLEIHHNCTFSVLSRKYPELEIKLWCNHQKDIIELKGDRKSIKNAIKDFEADGSVITQTYSDLNEVELVLQSCKCDSFPLTSVINRYDCLELPPVKYLSGVEEMTLLVIPENVGSILEDIRREDPDANVNIRELSPLRKKDTSYPHYLPINTLTNVLTSKQLQALILAYREGYYEIPRKKDCSSLAQHMNINRRTFAEHLRKAEKKLIGLIMPSLMLKQ